jgi:hypothetical protein
MADRFTAYLAHDLIAAEFYRLPELVAEAWAPPVHEADEPVRWGDADATWPWAASDADGCIPFAGPEGVRGLVGPRLIALAHPTPWDQFEAPTVIRGRLRLICRSLARTLGSTRWVYLASSLDPIDLLIAGRGFDDLDRWLARHPRPAFELVGA